MAGVPVVYSRRIDPVALTRKVWPSFGAVEKRAVVNRLFALVEPGVFRCPGLTRGAWGNSKEAGEAQSWARRATSEDGAPTWASCSSTRPS
jgi:hypothetical protein